MKKTGFSIGIPPLLLIGTIIVLFPIFTYMTVDRISRQRDQSARLLLEKSAALIRAFEAGTYTGMMNMEWNRKAMENLLTETGALPDIAYIFIVDRTGSILVHSRKEEKGRQYGQNLDLGKVLDSGRLHWRIKPDKSGRDVFEAYKEFTPVRPRKRSPPAGMPGHQRMRGRHQADTYRDTVIFVGLDMRSIEEAYKNDIQHSIIMGVILALIGFSGFILVFLVQRYAAARSSLSRIKIFSDNLVENMPVGMIATDMNGRVVSVNPVARTIFEIPASVDPREVHRYLPAEVLDFTASPTSPDSPDRERTLREKEIRVKSSQGHPMVLEIIASPLYDKAGASMGGLILIRDKTELDRLRTEMEANKRFAAIGRLAAGVAHEIRNPLSALKGYAVVLKEAFDKSSENYQMADMITREADRLNRVVSDMGELARPVAISKEPVNLEAVIRDSLSLIGRETDLHNVSVETALDPDAPEIHADPDKLRQVLLNLVLNAVQAMKGSGTLTIKLSRDQSGRNLIIEVADTGEGISREDRPDIFEPYFTTKQSGTGLGLAVVRNIVKAHQGEIKVSSEPGRGTVVRVILPRQDETKNE